MKRYMLIFTDRHHSDCTEFQVDGDFDTIAEAQRVELGMRFGHIVEIATGKTVSEADRLRPASSLWINVPEG